MNYDENYADAVRILMADRCTLEEAKRCIANGAVIIYDSVDFERNLENYMRDWDFDAEDCDKFRRMVRDQIPVEDWSISEIDGKRYYIAYIN